MGDQILEINGYKTESMTHSDAIDIIQNGGQTVRLLVRRTGKLPPAFGKFILIGQFMVNWWNNVEKLIEKSMKLKYNNCHLPV